MAGTQQKENQMSEYKISDLVPERVLNYRFSVSSKYDPEYLKLKDSVRAHNKKHEAREEAGLEPHYLRVRGRGRGPKVKGGNRYSVTDSNATYFDVYVQRDTDAMARYRERTAGSKARGFIAKSVSAMAALTQPAK